MTGRSLRFMRSSILPVMAGVALMAVHATILRYIFLHTTLSTAVAAGVILIVVIKHLGLFGSFVALFRRLSKAHRP
jgi:hypothetical protein